MAAAIRAFKKFQADEMTDRAAALTYYLMMSLFPALLVGVSLLGLIGNESLVEKAVDYARDNGAPAEVTDALQALLTKTVSAAGGAVSSALVLGVAVALYGASGAFGAAGRALNDVYDVKETRSFIPHKLADIGFTMLVIALALVALVSVFLGGNLAGDLFGTIGLGATAASYRWFGETIDRVPLESFEEPLAMLHERCERLVVLGSSKGGEAALLLGSLHAEIDAVVAVSAPHVVWAGLSQERPQRSSWTRGGEPLSFVPYDDDWEPDTDPVEFVGMYEQSLETYADRLPAARIPVERIQG